MTLRSVWCCTLKALFLLFASSILIECTFSTAHAATATRKVRLYYNLGPVEIELYGNESPLHVANFFQYVNNGDYDGSFIHRTRAFNPGMPQGHNFFAQGGSYGAPIQFLDDNPIAPGPPVDNEFNAANGLSNTPGSLAAARTSDPDSATSGWFINTSDNSASFDSGPYTVFGQVTSGMNLVDLIPFLPNIGSLAGSPFESMPIYNNQHLVTIYRALEIPLLEGDYNFNGTVDAADLVAWETNLGSKINLEVDGNGNGIVDGGDFLVWQKNFGASSPALASVLTIPEPSTAGLAILGFLTSLGLRRRRNTSV